MTAEAAHYQLLVCGATFAGLGAAIAAKLPVIVVERSAGVGQEFIETFNPGSFEAMKDLPFSPLEQSLHTELIERSLMEPGGGPVHLPGVHSVLCKRIQDTGLKVLFLTEIIEVKATGEGFEVTLYNVSGFQTIRVDRILDTTSRRFSQPDQSYAPVNRKIIRAHLSGGVSGNETTSNVQPLDEQAQILPGRFPSERILALTVDAGTDWPAARHSLQEYWRARPASLALWTIAAVASTFGLQVPQGPIELAAQWIWLPSESSPHPLQAFRQGYRFLQLQSEEDVNDGYRKTI
ncbi:hypothetical protein [Paenibacillus sp. UNC451MF]|uniref:hypothetical protein n=1 Tax=Paenibacillus sp. UNC451MF TaxID=1449063 RepID=UPI00048BE817|nr:hypothetical protein [Paenibacillus sp. UNC451MF]